MKLNIAPINGKLLDVNSFVKQNLIQEVTSHRIYEPNSLVFDPQGLFSEIIFGTIMSEDRYKKFGYIKLNTDILQPLIYDILKHLKSSYIKILEGYIFAKIDPKTKQFIIVDRDDPQGKTGYNFFIKNLYNINLDPSNSDIKKEYIATFKKYQKAKLLTCDKLIVVQAGLREIVDETKILAKDDVNSIYMTILSMVQSIPSNKPSSDIYNSIRMTVQKKVYEVFIYFYNFTRGKHGYITDKFANRNITFGTRNVASIDIKNASSPDDDRNLKPNEVKVSLYQFAKMYQPFIIKLIKDFFEQFLSLENVSSQVLNKDYSSKIVPISTSKKENYIDVDKIEIVINKLKYNYFKDQIIKVTSDDNKEYPLAFIYNKKRKIYLFNNKEEVTTFLDEPFDPELAHFVTWVELIYILSMRYLVGEKYAFVTRYPVIESESIKGLLVKLSTTTVNERKLFIDHKTKEEVFLPDYPIMGKKYIETVSVNQLAMQGFGLDIDGDMINVVGVWSNEGNEEIKKYMNSINSYIKEDFSFKFAIDDTSKYVLDILTSDK